MLKSNLADLLPPWAGRIHPYPAGKPIEEVERQLGRKAIKLASNENPLGPSPKAIQAVQGSLSKINLYPDSAAHELTHKLAKFYQMDPGQVITGAGSTELIELAVKTFLSPGDEGLTSESTFYIYRRAVEETGAIVTLIPLRDMGFDLGRLREAVSPRTKLIYLANPNNPTGTMFTADDLGAFLNSVPARVLVILDEAYCHYVRRKDYPRSLDYVRAGRNLLVLRTFSKIYGLAGLRVGYGFGPAELITWFNRVRAPFSTSRPAQAAAAAALEDQDYVAKSIELNTAEMRFVSDELTLLGVRFTPSSANFLLIDTARDCEQDFLRLLEQGVIVRPMKVYGFPTSLRITLGTRQENEQFLAALRHVLAIPEGARSEFPW